MSTVGKLMFHWSSYWKTWSRVLSEDHDNGLWVELDLTPINGADGDWDKVKSLNIRVMQNPRHRKEDIIADELPFAWQMDILRQLGGNLEHRVYNEDFYSQIDWTKFHVYDDGGAPFDLIKKG